MGDDREQTGKADDARIDVDQEHEVRYWAGQFGVTPEEIRSAV